MNVGGRIDAWLLRHGTWFLPGLLAALAAAMALTVAFDSGPADAPRMTPLVRAPLAAPRGTPVPPVDAVASVVPVLPATAASRDGQVEVCAVGWVGVDTLGSADLRPVLEAPAVRRGRRALVRALAVSGDELARGAALKLDGVVRAGAGPGPHPSVIAAASDLAAFAATSRDPRVYQLAVRECAQVPGAACQALDAGQWARLDEGNGVPWLFVLADAVGRGDAAGRDEALFRLARAQRFDERPYATAAVIADLAGNDDASVLAAWTLGVDSFAATDAALVAAFSALTQTCRAASADADRWQMCHGVADLMLQRSDSLDAFVFGKSLAGILGRDTRGLETTRDAAVAALTDIGSGGKDCIQMRRDFARWQGSAVSGQVSMLRPLAAPRTGR